MRVASWNPERFIAESIGASMDRLRKAAVVVRDAARAKVLPVWPGPYHGPYKTGKYAGKIWTARDQDNLLKTIRVVEKRESSGFAFAQASKNVWIMAGNYKTWYAQQVEFGKGGWKGGPHPFLRPAFNQSKTEIRSILENGE